MKKLYFLFILIAAYSNNVFAQAPVASGAAPAQTPPKAPVVHKVKKEAVPTRAKEEIIDFIFAKSQKYNQHFAEYKRDIDTIFYNGKVKAEIDITEIDTIIVADNTIKISSKLGIKKF